MKNLKIILIFNFSLVVLTIFKYWVIFDFNSAQLFRKGMYGQELIPWVGGSIVAILIQEFLLKRTGIVAKTIWMLITYTLTGALLFAVVLYYSNSLFYSDYISPHDIFFHFLANLPDSLLEGCFLCLIWVLVNIKNTGKHDSETILDN